VQVRSYEVPEVGFRACIEEHQGYALQCSPAVRPFTRAQLRFAKAAQPQNSLALAHLPRQLAPLELSTIFHSSQLVRKSFSNSFYISLEISNLTVLSSQLALSSLPASPLSKVLVLPRFPHALMTMRPLPRVEFRCIATHDTTSISRSAVRARWCSGTQVW
jgi:hypothetical protein